MGARCNRARWTRREPRPGLVGLAFPEGDVLEDHLLEDGRIPQTLDRVGLRDEPDRLREDGAESPELDLRVGRDR